MTVARDPLSLDDDVQPYAAAYLAAHPDRAFAAWPFLSWMFDQWREWAAVSGADLCHKTPEMHDAFGVIGLPVIHLNHRVVRFAFDHEAVGPGHHRGRPLDARQHEAYRRERDREVPDAHHRDQ